MTLAVLENLVCLVPEALLDVLVMLVLKAKLDLLELLVRMVAQDPPAHRVPVDSLVSWDSPDPREQLVSLASLVRKDCLELPV